MRRTEVREAQRDAEGDDAVAQDIDDAAPVQLGGQPLGEPRLGDVRITAAGWISSFQSSICVAPMNWYSSLVSSADAAQKSRGSPCSRPFLMAL